MVKTGTTMTAVQMPDIHKGRLPSLHGPPGDGGGKP